MSDEIDVDEVIAEAKEDYSLEDSLNQSSRRSDTITVFTDEVTGEKLGFARDEDEMNIFGVKVGTKRIREGVLGEVDALDPKGDAAKIKRLTAEADALRKQLKATSFTFNLRAVPSIVERDCARKAKQDVGITGKGIPDAKEEDFNEAKTARVLSQVVASYIDHRKGVKVGLLSFEGAKHFGHLLPDFEFLRLTMAVSKIQYKRAIDESVTDEASF